MSLSAVIRIIKTGSFFALPVLVAAVLLFLTLTTLEKHARIADASAALLAQLAFSPAFSGSGTLPPGPFLRLSVQSKEGAARVWTSPDMQNPDRQKNRPVLTIRRGQDSILTSLSKQPSCYFHKNPR